MRTVSKDETAIEVICEKNSILIDAEDFLREANIRMEKRLAKLRGEKSEETLSFSNQFVYSRQ